MTAPKKPRVLVVDDSAFARRVMREVLAADGRIDVVGYARDGLEALEKIDELDPDVVTLDLVMPDLDGVGVLDALRTRPRPPHVVVVSTSAADSPLGVAALAAGAFEVVSKPTALATDVLYDVARELVPTVLAAAEAHRPPVAAPEPAAVDTRAAEEPAPRPRRAGAPRIVVIGASTGGPRAVALLLRELPANLPVPVAIVVHMPAGYTEAFAQRLDTESALAVSEARPGLVAGPGTVTIAKAGLHLRVRACEDGFESVLDVAPAALHRPAVDELFRSAAEAFGGDVLAIVLTGMGADGVEGARAVRAAGGTVLVEDASSCVVYGMPRAVVEAGLADARVPLEGMVAAILARL